jgi:hypothetical protein
LFLESVRKGADTDAGHQEKCSQRGGAAERSKDRCGKECAAGLT